MWIPTTTNGTRDEAFSSGFGCCCCCLHLESLGLTTTTRALEVSTLGTDVRLSLAPGDTRCRTEVLLRLPSLRGSTQENGVGTGGCDRGELVESQTLSTSLRDPSPSSRTEAESTDAELREIQESDVVRDSSDDDRDLVLLPSHVAGNPRHGHHRSVLPRHLQTVQDDLVELRTRTTSQEFVQLCCGRKGRKER